MGHRISKICFNLRHQIEYQNERIPKDVNIHVTASLQIYFKMINLDLLYQKKPRLYMHDDD